ncbi:hypothetical protein DPEC_G00201620 [Dallia pectoralis]|uniref:Uncharacterized protein n=1 Tax=Dallia pectoralis TaxID=75939 RepID=A0ACC2G979_DALPE|nr:hypothetical protein DPEC_G00201620 [Dallia pectoralis]
MYVYMPELIVLLLIAVIWQCIVMALDGLICNLLTKRPKKCDTGSENPQLVDVEQNPLQPEDIEVQYASLGRQNWKKTSEVQSVDQHHVIYSAVVTSKPGVHGLDRKTH